MKTFQNPKTFLSEYVDFISKIGQCVDSFVWWGCIISSKNRFYTRFIDVLLEKPTRLPGLADYLRNVAGLIKHVAVLILRLTLSKFLRAGYKARVLARYQGKKTTLIKTFGYHFTNFSSFQDPIFQDLPTRLSANGENVLTLYEPVNVFWKSVKEKDPNHSTLSYFDLVGYGDVLRVAGQILNSFQAEFGQRRKLQFNSKDISKSFRSLYLFEHLSPATLHSMTYYYMTKNLCRSLDIRKFIYTYENNSWERMCLRAFREFSPATKLLACQHNVVPLASANMFLGREEEDHAPVPDVVLTSGQKPLEILRSYGHFQKVRLEATAAIRYRYLENIQVSLRNLEKPKLLVALEGVWQAAQIMDALFTVADDLQGWTVVVRTHQALSYDRLQSRIKHDITHFPYFQLSTEKTLKDDIAQSTAVLYWGSTVALETIKFGKPLINIKLIPEVDFDPLFELRAMKQVWVPGTPLKPLLQAILGQSQADYELELQQGLKYLNEYFHPVTGDNLRPFFA